MVWEGVPWFVAEADHSAEVARLLASAATGGREGIVAPGDCKVQASAIPDGNVRVQSGGVVLNNRFGGGGQQSYVARNVGESVVALVPQGSSGVRYDLVAVIVEDPQYAGQPEPADVATGPYVRTVVYQNVPATTRSLFEVDADQTGLALALVKFDASDGTILNGDITDLRVLVNPRSERDLAIITPPSSQHLESADLIWWPQVEQEVLVPVWSNFVTIVVHLSQFALVPPNTDGDLRVRLGNIEAGGAPYDYDLTGGERTSIIIGAKIAVPQAMRGTLQKVRVYGRRLVFPGHTGFLASSGGNMVFDTFFTEVP